MRPMRRWLGLGRDICLVDLAFVHLWKTTAKAAWRVGIVMRDRNKPGLRFYAPSADAQLREAMSRAHERGVEWRRIDEVLKDEEERGAADAIQLIDELKPLSAPTTTKRPLRLRSTKNAKLG